MPARDIDAARLTLARKIDELIHNQLYPRLRLFLGLEIKMPVLAFTTFAIMKGPYGDPVVKGFEDRTPITFTTAEQSPGFIERAKEQGGPAPHLSNFERDWGKWGKFAVPRFYDGGYTLASDTRACTLSLWRDINSVHHFVYRSLHREALAKRAEWFRKPEWPTYAMWWVADHAIPTWKEASARLEHLHDHSATPIAFGFHRRFSPSDCPLELSLSAPIAA
jgi:hypothetical protein